MRRESVTLLDPLLCGFFNLVLWADFAFRMKLPFYFHFTNRLRLLDKALATPVMECGMKTAFWMLPEGLRFGTRVRGSPTSSILLHSWPPAAWERAVREPAWPRALTQMTLADLTEHLSPSSLSTRQGRPKELFFPKLGGRETATKYSTSCLSPISLTKAVLVKHDKRELNRWQSIKSSWIWQAPVLP